MLIRLRVCIEMQKVDGIQKYVKISNITELRILIQVATMVVGKWTDVEEKKQKE